MLFLTDFCLRRWVVVAAGGRGLGTGSLYEGEIHYLRSYIAQIGRKLEPEPSRPRYFMTEAGMGYRFELASEESEETPPGMGSD